MLTCQHIELLSFIMSHKKLQELQKILKRLKSSKGTCILEGCNQPAIASHTLSHKRILKLLEEKDDKNQFTVLHLEDRPHVDFKNQRLTKYHDAERKLVRKGTNEASVFYGLCQPHDSDLFQQLDNEKYSNEAEINFLHAYRAFNLYTDQSNSVFQIIEKDIEPQFRGLPLEVEKLQNELKKIEPILNIIPNEHLVQFEEIKPALFKIEDQIKNQIIGGISVDSRQIQGYLGVLLEEHSYPMKGSSFKKALSNINDSLSQKFDIPDTLFDKVIESAQYRITENNQIAQRLENTRINKNYDELYYLHRSISNVLGLAGNFVFNHSKIGLITLTILPEQETSKTHIVFSTYENANIYFGQLNLMDNLTFERYVTAIIVNQGTNVFFSHSFWKQVQNGISDTILSGKKVRAITNLNLFKKKDQNRQ